MNKLTPFVSSLTDSVFTLDNLPEEVIAVLFAYYSRSVKPLRENLLMMIENGYLPEEPDWSKILEETQDPKLSDWLTRRNSTPAKTTEFHEKWVLKYGHSCYLGDTQVLTNYGWLTWKDVVRLSEEQEDLEFLSLNLETGDRTYHPATRIICEDYHGDLCNFRFHRGDSVLQVTPNHRMVVHHKTRSNFTEAEKLTTPFTTLGNLATNEPIPSKTTQYLAEYTLLGIAFAAGKFDSSFSQHVYFLRDSLPNKARRAILECATKLPIRVLQKTPRSSLYIDDSTFPFLDKPNLNILPPNIFSVSHQAQVAFLEGVLLANPRKSIVGLDKKQTNALQELMTLVGWWAKAEYDRASNTWGFFPIVKGTTPLSVTPLSPTRFVGKVYCAEVPPHNSLFIRQGNIVFICGNSVAEHAITHIGIEDLSIVITKVIEDARLASFTEKSSRYVVFSEDKFKLPPEIAASPHAKEFRDYFRNRMATYVKFQEDIRNELVTKANQEGWDQVTAGQINAKACDIARYILPLATTTSLGMTTNARSLETLLSKMYTTNLTEAHQLADQIKAAVEPTLPTLLKYTQPSLAREVMEQTAKEFTTEYQTHTKDVELVAVQGNLQTLLRGLTYNSAPGIPSGMVPPHIVQLVVDGRDNYTAPPRAFELISLTFSIQCDIGAWRDLQRHRMTTQIPLLPTPELGFTVPDEALTHHRKIIEDSVTASWDMWQKAAEIFGTEIAQYCLLLANKIEFLLHLNLREFYHLVELRSKHTGHSSYRKIAYQMWEKLNQFSPLLAKGVRVTPYHSEN